MDYCINAFNQMLDYYEALQKKSSIEIDKCYSGKLNCINRGSNKNYFQAYKEDGKKKFKGITKDEYAIRSLSRKEYLSKVMAIVDSNIALLKYAIAHYKTIEPDNILQTLTSTYRGLPLNYFLEEYCDDDWVNEGFEQSTYKVEQKNKIASNGQRVRSKSELFIVEKFLVYGVPFRYEQMLYIENHSFSPDFTIKTKSGLLYWEHCGMMHIDSYRKDNKWKLSMYEKAGIVPWKNLIITYDTEDGGINLGVIDAEIRNRILTA